MKIIEFIAAVILSAILLPVGIVYNIITFWKKSSMKMPFLFVTAFFIEIYNLFHTLAIFIDRIGNIILGKMFIDLFLIDARKNVGFGKFGITISASFGHCLIHKNLNKKGIYFVGIIDKIFGFNHCYRAFSDTNIFFK